VEFGEGDCEGGGKEREECGEEDGTWVAHYERVCVVLMVAVVVGGSLR